MSIILFKKHYIPCDRVGYSYETSVLPILHGSDPGDIVAAADDYDTHDANVLHHRVGRGAKLDGIGFDHTDLFWGGARNQN